MKTKFSVLLFVVALVVFSVLVLAGVYSQTETTTLDYLKNQAQTPWNSMAQAAGGVLESNLDYLKLISQNQRSATTYAKYILALVALGKNPTDFGNEDYVSGLLSYFNNNQFGDESLLNDDIWALIALGSLGQGNSLQAQKAKDFILSQQNNDGGWGYQVGVDSDTNDTAAAIMALLEAGVVDSDVAIQKAVVYLKMAQNDDGGFSYSIGADSDSCSDAWVMSAVYKLGQDPADSNWTKNNKNAKQSLLSLRDADGGFWWQKSGDNKMCTPYAFIALLGKFYPIESSFNEHNLRVQGKDGLICQTKTNGATPLGLIQRASRICNYTYSIIDYPGLGLYLAKINQEQDWMYLVNNQAPEIGAGSYYLSSGDDVLWYAQEGQAPLSHQANLKVEIETLEAPPVGDQGSISFVLEPDNLDFGKLKPGEQASRELNLRNGPAAGINVEADVSGDNVFKDNLKIDSQDWHDFSLGLNANQTQKINLQLNVPSDYQGSSGVKEGELIFWATKK